MSKDKHFMDKVNSLNRFIYYQRKLSRIFHIREAKKDIRNILIYGTILLSVYYTIVNTIFFRALFDEGLQNIKHYFYPILFAYIINSIISICLFLMFVSFFVALLNTIGYSSILITTNADRCIYISDIQIFEYSKLNDISKKSMIKIDKSVKYLVLPILIALFVFAIIAMVLRIVITDYITFNTVLLVMDAFIIYVITVVNLSISKKKDRGKIHTRTIYRKIVSVHVYLVVFIAQIVIVFSLLYCLYSLLNKNVYNLAFRIPTRLMSKNLIDIGVGVGEIEAIFSGAKDLWENAEFFNIILHKVIIKDPFVIALLKRFIIYIYFISISNVLFVLLKYSTSIFVLFTIITVMIDTSISFLLPLFGITIVGLTIKNILVSFPLILAISLTTRSIGDLVQEKLKVPG